MVEGFSSLSKVEKVSWLKNFILKNQSLKKDSLENIDLFWHENEEIQKIIDEFSENTIANFPIPYGLAPNFVINNKVYCVPMCTEESSVVAAASKAAKFWSSRGGFKGRVISTKKLGHVHFFWNGDKEILQSFFTQLKTLIKTEIEEIELNMKKRGGGVHQIELKNPNPERPNYFQIEFSVETCEAMGANFINSILETAANVFQSFINDLGLSHQLEIVMSILSNYTPDCLVEVEVSAPIKDMKDSGYSGEVFCQKFINAVDIANLSAFRATTHNKGIMNGIDSVVLATGNDFRAVESCAHAYASKNGQYQSLTSARIEKNIFYFSIKIPLSLGTVGGLTKLHPLANFSLKILDNPSVKDLMIITASVGLAQNFAAIKSLVTTGIQKGHMKMHLINILRDLNASEFEFNEARKYFEDETISYSKVKEFVNLLRKNSTIGLEEISERSIQ